MGKSQPSPTVGTSAVPHLPNSAITPCHFHALSPTQTPPQTRARHSTRITFTTHTHTAHLHAWHHVHGTPRTRVARLDDRTMERTPLVAATHTNTYTPRRGSPSVRFACPRARQRPLHSTRPLRTFAMVCCGCCCGCCWGFFAVRWLGNLKFSLDGLLALLGELAC